MLTHAWQVRYAPRFPSMLMGLFFVATLVAPAAPVNKAVFLLMIFRCLVDLLFADRGAVRQTTAPFLVLGIFAYGFFISVLEATDTEVAPWHIVPADDKKRARLNCISHLLSLIPYEQAPREKVKLPKLSKKGSYDDQATLKGRRFVPERY